MTDTRLACAYCGEAAVSRVSPHGSEEDVLVCEDHEERAIVEYGQGVIEPVGPQLRVIDGGVADSR